MSQVVILHVEDDPDDAFFVARALSNALPKCVVKLVKDGREAIEYLERSDEVSNTDNPNADLVLLDLKLPDVSGFEVLQWIRSEPRFKNLPVFILSGSSIVADRERCQKLGAHAYIVKTVDYEDVVTHVAALVKDKLVLG